MAQAQIIYGPYPMSIDQMNTWAKEVGKFTVAECAQALHFLNAGRVTIRRA